MAFRCLIGAESSHGAQAWVMPALLWEASKHTVCVGEWICNAHELGRWAFGFSVECERWCQESGDSSLTARIDTVVPTFPVLVMLTQAFRRASDVHAQASALKALLAWTMGQGRPKQMTLLAPAVSGHEYLKHYFTSTVLLLTRLTRHGTCQLSTTLSLVART